MRFNRSALQNLDFGSPEDGPAFVVSLALVFSLILWLIPAAPQFWWVWGFLFLSLFQLVLAVLYPVLIAPLFNKFEAIKEEDSKKNCSG